MYAPAVGQSAAVDARFHALARRRTEEARLASELLQLQGQLDMLMAASAAAGGSRRGGGGAGGDGGDDKH